MFFPKHWSAFLEWLRTKNIEELRSACTPGLLSTEWWVQRRFEKMWTPWFIRFTFERGWYSLYTNFPNQESFAINYREAGLNFNQTKGPMNKLVTELNPAVHFNFTRNPPIFDFHFSSIEKSNLLSIRSNLWHPTNFINQCFTVKKRGFVPSKRVVKTLACDELNQSTSDHQNSTSNRNCTKRIYRKFPAESRTPESSGYFQWNVLIETAAIFPGCLIVCIWGCLTTRKFRPRKKRQNKSR